LISSEKDVTVTTFFLTADQRIRSMANTGITSFDPSGKRFSFKNQSVIGCEKRTENFSLTLFTNGEFCVKHVITTTDSFDGESDTKQVICRGDWTICEETSSRVKLSGKCVNSRVSYKHCMDSDDENESSESDFNQVYSYEELVKMNYNDL